MPGCNEVAVRGESFHQDELLTLAGGRRPYGGVELDALAELVALVDQVVVLIDDTEVGCLSREDARRLAPAIREARREYGAATRSGWWSGAVGTAAARTSACSASFCSCPDTEGRPVSARRCFAPRAEASDSDTTSGYSARRSRRYAAPPSADRRPRGRRGRLREPPLREATRGCLSWSVAGRRGQPRRCRAPLARPSATGRA